MVHDIHVETLYFVGTLVIKIMVPDPDEDENDEKGMSSYLHI